MIVSIERFIVIVSISFYAPVDSASEEDCSTSKIRGRIPANGYWQLGRDQLQKIYCSFEAVVVRSKMWLT